MFLYIWISASGYLASVWYTISVWYIRISAWCIHISVSVGPQKRDHKRNTKKKKRRGNTHAPESFSCLSAACSGVASSRSFAPTPTKKISSEPTLRGGKKKAILTRPRQSIVINWRRIRAPRPRRLGRQWTRYSAATTAAAAAKVRATERQCVSSAAGVGSWYSKRDGRQHCIQLEKGCWFFFSSSGEKWWERECRVCRKKNLTGGFFFFPEAVFFFVSPLRVVMSTPIEMGFGTSWSFGRNVKRVTGSHSERKRGIKITTEICIPVYVSPCIIFLQMRWGEPHLRPGGGPSGLCGVCRQKEFVALIFAMMDSYPKNINRQFLTSSQSFLSHSPSPWDSRHY